MSISSHSLGICHILRSSGSREFPRRIRLSRTNSFVLHTESWRRNSTGRFFCRANLKDEESSDEPAGPEPTRQGTSDNPEKTSSSDSSEVQASPPDSVKVNESSAITPSFPSLTTGGGSSQLPREVIETLRNQVFGFDTFFVTDQEPYEGGVLFKGNLRGDSAKAFAKIQVKLKDKFRDRFVLYLLNEPQDDRPVAVVVPKEAVEPLPAPVPEWITSAAFGLISALTLLLANSPSPEFGFLPDIAYLTGPLLQGLPQALALALVLAAHEAGHILAAKDAGIKLGLPFFVPSWQLGCFGAITPFKSIVPGRQQLVKVASAGPLFGFSLSLLLLLVGFFLTASGAAGDAAVTIEGSAFHDSVLVGSLAKLFFGDALTETSSLSLHPLVLTAWSGLLINALSCIPVGELDGGRIFLGIFGRQAATRISTIALILLVITGIFNDVALFWGILVIILQRGPITPSADEISEPEKQTTLIGAGLLVLSLLVYSPLIFPFSELPPPTDLLL